MRLALLLLALLATLQGCAIPSVTHESETGASLVNDWYETFGSEAYTWGRTDNITHVCEYENGVRLSVYHSRCPRRLKGA